MKNVSSGSRSSTKRSHWNNSMQTGPLVWSHHNPSPNRYHSFWFLRSPIYTIYTGESVAGWVGGFLADKVSGQTTGPILMPFCIQTTYWSPTWLGVFFSKISKYGNSAHTFDIYSITPKLCNQIWRNCIYSFLDGFLNFL